MRQSIRAMLPLALPVLCAYCAAGAPPPAVPQPRPSMAREGYVTAADGVRLFFRAIGSGPDTLIVLHGGPGFSMSYFVADLEPLGERHVLIFYDQRGAGRSTLVTDSAALDAQRFADDLEAVRRHFGLERVNLLGHSWGAGVVALYAARYQERVGRLLIVGAIPARYAQLTEAFQTLNGRRDSAAIGQMAALRAARLANPGDAAACRAYYAVFFRPAFADSTALRRSRGDFCGGAPEALTNKVKSVDRYTMSSLGEWDWRPTLRTINAPTLVIHGAYDFMPIESSREWAALPNGRLLVIEGSGHFPYLDTPERFFTAADAFLRGAWPEGAIAVRI